MTSVTNHRRVTVRSRLLGDLVVNADSLIDFPRGLLGFPEQTQYALAASEREGLFWLQSVESPALTFLLADPFTFIGDCTIDVPDAEATAIGAPNPNDLLLLSIVTVGETAGSATANLQGPVLINRRAGIGRQVALVDPHAPLRAPIELHQRAA